MKSYFLFTLAIFSLFGCKKEAQKVLNNWEIISQNVQYSNHDDFLKLKSGKFNYEIPTKNLPYKKIVLLNASLVGYFTALGLEEKIIGISSPEYLFSDKIHQLIKEEKILNIGNEQKYDVEKIIAMKPDAIFTNYIPSFDNTYDLLKKNGIEIIFLDEYLERNPMEKSKYLLVFGKLMGVEKTSITVFNEIQNNYDSLKVLAKNASALPVVLANEMYGNQWFLPGGKTNFARFVADANAKYINAENQDSKAVPMSFEEVFSKSHKAEYWVNIGNHQSKKELQQINPNYAEMNIFNNGKLYTITGKEKGKSNDYFESGVVRADIVLKDYIKIFHPELLPDYSLTYMKELK